MDIIRLYQDYGINYATEGHRHCRDGWVNTVCPFCSGNPGYHLGFELDTKHFVCWRCGGHSINDVLQKLLHVSYQEAKTISKTYGVVLHTEREEPDIIIRRKSFKLPSNTTSLQKNHRIYLENRNFDPENLEKMWNLMGTGPISLLDHINYRFRIIIPFFWDKVQVSFDSRDITGKALNRYQACPADRELIPHKSILYGKQEKWKETGICVEGPTDVWRFGVNSFATSGIKYTPRQVRCIASIFKRVAICFDDDPQAIEQAKKLSAELKFRGVDAFRVDIKGDPGSMKQEDADYLVKQLIK